jgi:hypothetical protein
MRVFAARRVKHDLLFISLPCYDMANEFEVDLGKVGFGITAGAQVKYHATHSGCGERFQRNLGGKISETW